MVKVKGVAAVVEDQMWAGRLHKPGHIRCERVPMPRPGPDEALIRVKACGVCGSDHSRVMVNGTYSYPTIVGHEFAGEVVEVGLGVEGFSSGDRVTVVPLIPCGRCVYCELGRYHLCEDYDYFGSRRDGAFAEYVVAPASNMIRIPDSVDWETAAMTDPASVALHAIRQGGLAVGQSVAVLGAGPIGLFAVQWARIAGASRVAAVDIVDRKIELAEELGADITINALRGDPVATLRAAVPDGFSCVVETAGSSITQQQAIHLASKGGTVVLCGISHDRLPLTEESVDRLMRHEITIVGSWNSSFSPDSSANDWSTAVEFFGRKLLVGLPMVSHRYNLHQIKEAFEMASDRQTYFNKIMFIP